MPDELLSPEEALKILAAALKKSAEAGLSKLEIQRLRVLFGDMPVSSFSESALTAAQHTLRMYVAKADFQKTSP